MFTFGFKPFPNSLGNCYVAVSNGLLLCSDTDPWSPIDDSVWRFSNPQLNAPFYCIGQYQGLDCYAVALENTPEIFGHHWVDLRRLMVNLIESHYEIAARALQIIQWELDHGFCGRCGSATSNHEHEMAKHCGRCDLMFYPRLSPCVIMLITRGNECLLARNGNFPGAFYSALAGFIEVGETIEGALRREVLEEVSLRVGALTYFGSQSWPFPGQLMIGFHAEYEHGEIEVDGEEIVEANWYRYDNLPQVPNQFSLAGQLINQFVKSQQG